MITHKFAFPYADIPDAAAVMTTTKIGTPATNITNSETVDIS